MAPLFLSQAPDRLHFSMGTSHGGCPKDAGQWDTDPILSLTLYLRIPPSSICESEGSSPREQREARGGCTQCVRCSGVPERRGETLFGWGRGSHEDYSCRAGAGVLTKIPKHLSSEENTPRNKTGIVAFVTGVQVQPEGRASPAPAPPLAYLLTPAASRGLTQRLPSFPSQKMTTPISGIATLPIDSLGE